MNTPQTLPYRKDIQGLRAIAIVLVILAHAKVSLFSGGFVGVDIFFVLSGYLITGLLLREYTHSGSIQIIFFLSRRLKRLLPSLLVMIALVTFVTPLLLSYYEFREQIVSLNYAATWTSNIFFALHRTDYFAELQTRDLFLHTWSLGVEEQFYLVWPLLLLLLLTYKTQRLKHYNLHTVMLVTFGLFFLLSLGLSLYWASINPLWAFYLMPSRIWQFSLGALVFVFFEHNYNKGGVSSVKARYLWNYIGGIVGLLLIIGSAVFLNSDLNYPGLWALLPSLGAAMIIAAGSQGFVAGAGRILSHPILVWIGDRSYSWYLWHWPVLMLGFALGMQERFIYTIIPVILSFLLAMLSYRNVELPFWKGRLSYLSPARVILVSTISVIIVLTYAQSYLYIISLYDDEPSHKITDAARKDMPALYSYGYDSWYTSSDVNPYIIGEQNAEKTVLFIGDSIGTQWVSLLPRIFKTPVWRIIILTKSACPMVDEKYFYKIAGGNYSVCTEWRNEALNYIASIKPDIVLAGNSATYNFSEKQWIEGTRRVLNRIHSFTNKIIIVAGTPKLSFDGPGCLARWYTKKGHKIDVHNISVCREALKADQVVDVAGYLGQAVQPFSKASVLNLNDLVCPNRYCAAQNSEGLIVFRDQQHLTDTFVVSTNG